MSAANFAVLNARKYYVVSDVPENVESVLSSFQSWKIIQDSPAAWEESFFSRSYPGRYILEKSIQVNFCAGEQYPLTAKIVFRGGYYSGAVLDWNIFADAYTGSLDDYKGDAEDFAGVIVSGYLESLEYYNHWNKGIQAIMRPRFLEKLSRALEGIIQECENICAALSEEKYICLGHFSNGEAIYQKIA